MDGGNQAPNMLSANSWACSGRRTVVNSPGQFLWTGERNLTPLLAFIASSINLWISRKPLCEAAKPFASGSGRGPIDHRLRNGNSPPRGTATTYGKRFL